MEEKHSNARMVNISRQEVYWILRAGCGKIVETILREILEARDYVPRAEERSRMVALVGERLSEMKEKRLAEELPDFCYRLTTRGATYRPAWIRWGEE